MISAADIAAMSDADLDTAYAAYFDVHDMVTYSQLATEIGHRLTGVFSFLEGAVGVNRFPLYDARQNYFNQAIVAQGAIVSSAANVASTVKNYALGIGVPLLVAGMIVFYFVYVKRK